MNGKDIVKLAVDLTAGSITANAIKEQYGEGVLSSVMALVGGGLAGVLANSALDLLDKETGLVSDVGSVVDDVIDTFKFW